MIKYALSTKIHKYVIDADELCFGIANGRVLNVGALYT